MASDVGAHGAAPQASRARGRVVATPARFAALTLLALLTANCSSQVATHGRQGNKYGVAPSPKVIPDGQPIPKGGGREMIGKPYVVGDRTYVPREGRGYVREGEASWYGTAFHGRLTANGEVFDKESIAAAHPTLPLPSYVRVTNLSNHRSMIVRVNDRGPYERGRLIDLSERAAEALEFHHRGTTHVRVQYVGKASLQGSDDRKLLATLRTDEAAPGREPTMLAALDERGAGRAEAPLAYKPAQPRPAPRRMDVEEGEAEAPAPIVLASRDLGPPSRLSEPLPEPRLQRPVSAGAKVFARVQEPSADDVTGLNPSHSRLPVQVAQRSLPKSDRLAPSAAHAGRGAPPLDLAAIRAAINAAPRPPAARFASSLPPGRPSPARLAAAPEHSKPAGKLQGQVSLKGDRLRVADR